MGKEDAAAKAARAELAEARARAKETGRQEEAAAAIAARAERCEKEAQNYRELVERQKTIVRLYRPPKAAYTVQAAQVRTTALSLSMTMMMLMLMMMVLMMMVMMVLMMMGGATANGDLASSSRVARVVCFHLVPLEWRRAEAGRPHLLTRHTLLVPSHRVPSRPTSSHPRHISPPISSHLARQVRQLEMQLSALLLGGGAGEEPPRWGARKPPAAVDDRSAPPHAASASRRPRPARSPPPVPPT